MDVTKFWEKVRRTEKYPLLIKMVDKIRILPHMSAACERLFSSINLNKTKLRNRLGNDTLTGIPQGKTILKEMPCFEFMAPERMLKYFNALMYEYDEKKK